MYCIHCGNQVKEEDRFCNVCGAAVVAPDAASKIQVSDNAQADAVKSDQGLSSDEETQASLASQPQPGQKESHKRLSTSVIIILVLALVAIIALVAILVVQLQPRSGSVVEQTQSNEAKEAKLTDEEKVIKSLDGWWQRGARQWLDNGYVYFHNGSRYHFTADGQFDKELNKITPDMVHRHSGGLQGGKGTAAADTPGYFIDVNSGDLGFYLVDGSPDSLSWLREDGTGYSGGETTVRVDPPSWADTALASLGIEENAATSSSSSSANSAFDQSKAEAEARAAAETAGKTVLTGTVFVGTEVDWAQKIGLSRAPNPGSNITYAGLILDESVTVSARNADGATYRQKPYVERSGSYVLLGKESGGGSWSAYDGQHVSVAFTDFDSFSDSLGAIFSFKGEGERIAPLTEADVRPSSSADASGDYILPDSSTRRYSSQELEVYDDYTLFLARNEIFARHGRKFDSPELQQYFGSKSWYKGTIEASAFSESMLNDVELANAYMMRDIESARGSIYL